MSRLLIYFLCCLIYSIPALSLEPTSTQVRVKSANLNGNLGFTLAEFSMTFAEPLYFQFPAPCPAGRCAVSRQQEAIDADPCSFMPCDFTLKGADCGKARLSQCESICAEKRQEFCPPIQDWITLELGVESEPIYLSNRMLDVSLRVNFDKICHAMVVQVINIYGSGPILTYHYDTIEPTTSYNCQMNGPPEGLNVICPSFEQCYRYGTYFFKMHGFEPNAKVTVKVSALEIEAGPQRTQSLPDAPLIQMPDLLFPYHVPLTWSVPFTYTFPPSGAAVPFLLSSYYCGFVTLQINTDMFDDTVLQSESYIAFISLDPNNPFPSTITTDMLFLSIPFAKIFMCSDDPQTPARMFILLVRNRGAAFNVPGTITVTAEYDRPGLIPFAPAQKAGDIGTWSNYVAWPATNWYVFSEGALQINCPGFSKFDCTAGCEKFGCCQDTWPAYPTSPSLQPLYPAPYPLRFLNQDIIYTDFVYPDRYLDPYVLGVTLVLEKDFGGSIEYGPLGTNWSQILPQCTLSRGESPIGSLSGDWIRGIYQPEFIYTKRCQYDDFVQVSQNLDKIFQQFDDASRPLSLRYQADIMTMLDPWIDCRSFVTDVLLDSTILVLEAENTKECPSYVDDDPCCNPDLAWNQCCMPRTVEFVVDFPSQVGPEFDSFCTPLTECSLPILQTYIQGSLTEITGACEPGMQASPSEITTHSVVAFTSCMTQYFGKDFDGMVCYTDSDCPEVPSSRCDTIAHRCLGNVTILTAAFVECLVNTISAPARLSLIERQGWTQAVEKTPLVELILDAYSQEYCIHSHHPIMGTLYRPYYRTSTAFPNCAPGNFFALTNSRTATPWQSGRQVTGGNCAYDFYSVQPNIGDDVCGSAESYCNIDPSLDPQACLALPAAPFICETPTSCLPAPQAGVPLCLLANHTILTGLTMEQCSRLMSCTDPSYADLDSCQNSGVCDDAEQVYYSLDNTYWAAAHSRAGVCAFPMAPYDSPDCNVLYPGSLPTSLGCIRFGTCVSIGIVVECQVDFDSLGSCQMGGGIWYPYPDTKEKCQNPSLCDVPRYTGTRTSVWESTLQYLSEFPSEADCASCGGVQRSVNTWQANRWLGGRLLQAELVEAAIVAPYAFITSLDFMTLSRINIEAAEASTSFQTLNALQCSYGNQKVQIEPLACACSGSTQEQDRACFEQDSSASTGRGRFCPFTQNTIVSPPFTLESTNSSLAANVIYKCIDVQLKKIASQTFDVPQVVPVTIAFKRRQDIPFVPGSYEVVYNEQQALVGSVIGDGLTLRFDKDSEKDELSQFLLCQVLPLSITPNTNKYPVYDFGQVSQISGVVDVRPLHLDVNFTASSSNQQLCALIVLPHQREVTYVPIVRLANDQKVAGVTLTAGEKACLYSVASLFVVAILIWSYIFADTAKQKAINWTIPFSVVWVCSLWIFLQRAIYIYLVAADVLNQPNTDQLADYFMMDFPMCVYLIANFQIGLSFIFLYFKPGEDAKRFWIIFFSGSFLIIMLFIGVLLAYRYNVLDTPGLTGPPLCPIYHDTTDTARTIRLIYQSIILAVALCVGTCEAVTGSSVYRKISDIKDSYRVLIIALVASAGIICDSIAFLVYYIVDDPHPYFSIVLIFTEIMPLMYLTFQLRISSIRRAESSFSSYTPPSAENRTGTGATLNTFV